MSRNVGLLWIMAVAVALMATPVAVAQDVTGGMVTDPPAPVAEGYATFTGTYSNLGPGSADETFADYYIGIQPGTFTDEGSTALLESAEFTDINGNQAFLYIDASNCNHYTLELAQPGDGTVAMSPIPANEGGSFTFKLPVIPMEGINSGRVVVTEPEELRNAYTPLDPYYFVEPYSHYWWNAGTYNFVVQGGSCDDIPDPTNPDAACWDIAQCFGKRLWAIEPFEAELEVVVGNNVNWPDNTDPTFGCGNELVGFTAGKIAIIRRGTCPFYEKIENAQFADAAGAIIVNNGNCISDPNGNPDECVMGMATSDPLEPGLGYFIDIPFVQMGRRQGEQLIAAVQNGQTVRIAMGPIADPDGLEPFGVVVTNGTFPADANENDFTVTRVPLGEMGPTEFVSFVPAAAYAAGAQGAFFQTDLDLNNKGAEAATVTLLWLPRGADNSAPATSEAIVLNPGQSIQYENVLNAVFGAEPDVAGALAMIADSADVIAMSRTYNVPSAKIAGTFGQGLPGIPSDKLIQSGETRRIIFMSENDDIRANVGCVNGLNTPLRINIDMYDATGTMLETRTMDLGPWSNNQINRIFRTYAPRNGYVDVSTPTEGGAFYCYGSVLDNLTSDPTTVLPQVPSDARTFIPAAALAAGAQGAFFQTDVDLNNAGDTAATYQFGWLPRGENNSSPTLSDTFTLAAGASVRYENVLNAVFGAEPDVAGALVIEADNPDVLAMSRTYNIPGAKIAGTFGQELPGIPADMMIASGEKKRIIFMNENDDVRANVGCQNGVPTDVVVTLQLYNGEGTLLETKYMNLAPWSNNQINRVFRNYAPVNGYVDVFTNAPEATIYCYGSVLDNLTSDPTTVLPQ